MASGFVRAGGVVGTVTGAAAFQKLLESYPQQVISDIRAELETGADQLVDAIKERVPENTGRLASTIRKEAGGHDLSVVVTAGGPETTKSIGSRKYEREVRIGSGDTQGIARQENGKSVSYDYALGVEYGHKSGKGGHVAPHPFFWPAVRQGKLKIVSSMRKAMRARAKASS